MTEDTLNSPSVSKPPKGKTKPKRKPRSLDLVVHGATGFTGGLVAAYLAESAPAKTRIGLSGRNLDKLKAVQEGLGSNASKWPLIVADSSDDDALKTLANRTKVIISTVGPYAEHGLPLVKACAEAGTHYADLTGEVLFMKDSIDQFNNVAQESGARIVHSCGFDSIPSDLGVLAIHLAAKKDDGVGHLRQTEFVVTKLKGGASGGTLASGMGEMDRISSDAAAKVIAEDAYALSPNRRNEPASDTDQELRGIDYDNVLDTYVAPFVMAAVNSRVVRRSNALQDWAYGRNFHYRETLATNGGISGRLKATAISAGSTLGGLAIGNHLTRSVAVRFLPDPGEGPDEDARTNGLFEITLHSTSEQGAKYRGTFAAEGDPGYAATSVMISEAGLALAGDQRRLPKAAGCLTPATGIGKRLIERLQDQGFTITTSAHES